MNDQLDCEVSPVGRLFAPQELRKRNKELAKLGRRICRTHQGAALPLDDEHFYRVRKGGPRFETQCKACHNARIARRRRERYQADAAFVERTLETARQSNYRHAEDRRRRAREASQQKKAQYFTQIVGNIRLAEGKAS